MERRDRDRYDRNDYSRDYDRYEGYSPNDEHYHSSRNLTNEFEQDYQQERGFQENYRPAYSYHEGSLADDNRQYRSSGSGYSRNSDWRNDRDRYRIADRWNDRNRNSDRWNEWESSRGSGQWNDRDRNTHDAGNSSRDRGSFSNYRDDARDTSNAYSRDQSHDMRGNNRRGYGISDYGGTSDRYNTLNSNRNRWEREEDDYTSDTSDRNRSSRFSSGMGESFPGSNRGVPDSTYGSRSSRGNYGTGSTYGGSNYGGGAGYSGGQQGGTRGDSSYGSSSGNYGGYGSMGAGNYSSNRGSGYASRSSDRDIRVSGDF